MYPLHDAVVIPFFDFFFFNDTATTEIYTLSLHDALPICVAHGVDEVVRPGREQTDMRAIDRRRRRDRPGIDRKSTRLNSSHSQISYAVFCLKKKNISSSPSETLLVPATHTRCTTSF